MHFARFAQGGQTGHTAAFCQLSLAKRWNLETSFGSTTTKHRVTLFGAIGTSPAFSWAGLVVGIAKLSFSPPFVGPTTLGSAAEEFFNDLTGVIKTTEFLSA